MHLQYWGYLNRMVSTQSKRNQTISVLFKKKKQQTKETRIYCISAKNVNEQIKAKYFFVMKVLCFKKRLMKRQRQTKDRRDRRDRPELQWHESPANASRLWAVVGLKIKERCCFHWEIRQTHIQNPVNHLRLTFFPKQLKAVNDFHKQFDFRFLRGF